MIGHSSSEKLEPKESNQTNKNVELTPIANVFIVTTGFASNAGGNAEVEGYVMIAQAQAFLTMAILQIGNQIS